MKILIVYHFSQHVPYETGKEGVGEVINNDHCTGNEQHEVTVVDNLQEAVALLEDGTSFDMLLATVGNEYPNDRDLDLMVALAGRVKHIGVMTDAYDHWQRKLRVPGKRIAFVDFLAARRPSTGRFYINWGGFCYRTMCA